MELDVFVIEVLIWKKKIYFRKNCVKNEMFPTPHPPKKIADHTLTQYWSVLCFVQANIKYIQIGHTFHFGR